MLKPVINLAVQSGAHGTDSEGKEAPGQTISAHDSHAKKE
jgi:hypothetical protein